MLEKKNKIIEVKPDRLASADILKVLSIIAVVFIHGSFLIHVSSTYVDFISLKVLLEGNWLRFCVPVFIFIWAYFLEKNIMKHGNRNLLPRFYKLLIPFTLWSVIYFLILADFNKLSLSILVTKHFSGFGWSGQYYFIILFQFICLFPFIRQVAHRLKNHALAVYIVSVFFYMVFAYTKWFNIGIVEKIHHRFFIYWLPYVILGIIHAQKGFQKFPIAPVIALFSVLLIPTEIYLFHPQTVSTYVLPSVFLTTSLLLNSFMGAKLTYGSLSPRVGNIIQLIARNTLGIFCLNPLAIIGVNSIFNSFKFQWQFPGCSIAAPIISTAMILLICMLLIFLLKRIKLNFLVSS